MFEIIEECSIKELNNRELYWKIHYDCINKGLNCELYDTSPGPKSNETKLKISLEDLEFRAKQWATQHNGRSGRTARQFVDFLQGELELNR